MTSPDRAQDFERRLPPDDNRERMICRTCGWIHYENPRVVVTTVTTWAERILIARRAIDPRVGHWTLPGGFMEIGETAEAGAARETVEETGVNVDIDDLLAVYSLPHIGQVHLIYRARAASPEIDCGPESLEARFVTSDEIPWDDLAFPTNTWALRHFLEADGARPIAPFTAPEDALRPHRFD